MESPIRILIDGLIAPGLPPSVRRRSRLLAGLVVACACLNAIGCAVTFFVEGTHTGVIAYSITTVTMLVSVWLNKRGWVASATHIFIGANFVLVNGVASISQGAESAAFSVNATLVALAAILLGVRFAAMYTGLAFLVGLLFVVAPEQMPTARLPISPRRALLTHGVNLVYILTLVSLMVSILESALAEAEVKRKDLDTALSRLHQTSVSREYINNVIAAVRDILLVTDADHIVTDANPAALQQLGRSREKLVGMSMRDILVDSDLIDGACSRPTAALARRADGRLLPVLSSRGTLPVNGDQHGGHVWAMSDHTVQQAAVEAVRRAHGSAESANRAKSQFLANMSHELRTPLNAIIGYSELLSEDALSEGQHQDLGRIRNAGQHLLGLINGILDLSKVESGKMKLELSDLDLNHLVQETADTMSLPIRKKGLTFECSVASTISTARIDKDKTRQILLNLLSNAIKFTESGSITLTVDGWSREGTPWARFVVSDTGIGMTADQLEGVFEPFAQADESTQRRFGGTGLGLSISRAFTQMMGGEIYVSSQLGEGTTFTVELPIGELQLRTPGGRLRRESPSPPAEGELLVVHIDDDPAALELVNRLVASPTRRIAGTQDPEEGLRWAQTLNPSVLLVDVQMPRMSGWSVLAELKAHPSAPPVVILTAEGEEAVAHALGAQHFLRKPIDRQALIAAVEAVARA